MKSVALKVSETNFLGNSALNKGGAIFIDQNPFKLENVTFTYNQAQNGGAIYAIKNGTIDIFQLF